MIELTDVDEYGSTFCAHTFYTVKDAEDALYQLECALEDTVNGANAHRLRVLIAQLEDQIVQVTEAE